MLVDLDVTVRNEKGETLTLKAREGLVDDSPSVSLYYGDKFIIGLNGSDFVRLCVSYLTWLDGKADKEKA